MYLARFDGGHVLHGLHRTSTSNINSEAYKKHIKCDFSWHRRCTWRSWVLLTHRFRIGSIIICFWSKHSKSKRAEEEEPYLAIFSMWRIGKSYPNIFLVKIEEKDKEDKYCKNDVNQERKTTNMRLLLENHHIEQLKTARLWKYSSWKLK